MHGAITPPNYFTICGCRRSTSQHTSTYLKAAVLAINKLFATHPKILRHLRISLQPPLPSRPLSTTSYQLCQVSKLRIEEIYTTFTTSTSYQLLTLSLLLAGKYQRYISVSTLDSSHPAIDAQARPPKKLPLERVAHLDGNTTKPYRCLRDFVVVPGDTPGHQLSQIWLLQWLPQR